MKVKRKQKNNAIQSLELHGQKELRYDHYLCIRIHFNAYNY